MVKKQRRMLLKYKLIRQINVSLGYKFGVGFLFQNCSFYDKDKKANDVGQRVSLYVTVIILYRLNSRMPLKTKQARTAT